MFLLLIEKMKCVNKKNSYLLLNIWEKSRVNAKKIK